MVPSIIALPLSGTVQYSIAAPLSLFRLSGVYGVDHLYKRNMDWGRTMLLNSLRSDRDDICILYIQVFSVYPSI